MILNIIMEEKDYYITFRKLIIKNTQKTFCKMLLFFKKINSRLTEVISPFIFKSLSYRVE